MITGTTNNSRLIELKKYIITDVFGDKYVGNGSVDSDGVDYNNSISGVSVTYFIGGIKYVDDIIKSQTTFTVLLNVDNNFINVPYYKDMNKLNIINNPKINNDVFIDRQELSAFDLNYRLEFIDNLNDLETYAGGKFFNIIKYT